MEHLAFISRVASYLPHLCWRHCSRTIYPDPTGPRSSFPRTFFSCPPSPRTRERCKWACAGICGPISVSFPGNLPRPKATHTAPITPTSMGSTVGSPGPSLRVPSRGPDCALSGSPQYVYDLVDVLVCLSSGGVFHASFFFLRIGCCVSQ